MSLMDAEPSLRSRSYGVELRQVSARRWRVVDGIGRVVGHVRTEHQPAGVRFHAERFDSARACLREIGSFWRLDEAIECLRYLR